MVVGDSAPSFELPDTSGEVHAVPAEPAPPATVIVQTCNHCPYVIAWNPRLRQVAEDYAPKGVRFLGINSNDSVALPGRLARPHEALRGRPVVADPVPLRRVAGGRARARRGRDPARLRLRLGRTGSSIRARRTRTTPTRARAPRWLRGAIDAALDGAQPDRRRRRRAAAASSGASRRGGASGSQHPRSHRQHPATSSNQSAAPFTASRRREARADLARLVVSGRSNSSVITSTTMPAPISANPAGREPPRPAPTAITPSGSPPARARTSAARLRSSRSGRPDRGRRGRCTCAVSTSIVEQRVTSVDDHQERRRDAEHEHRAARPLRYA